MIGRQEHAVAKTSTLAALSVAVGILVLAIKLGAWRMTGSVALFSDAMESIVNVAASAAALVAIRYGARPADSNHPYGHHKAEYFSVVLEGVLIIVAAVAILREAYGAFLAPRMFDAPVEGLVASAIASAINGAWCWFLIREGRKRRSPALVADGKHLLTDVVTSAGVIVGLVAAYLSGIPELDPALAAIVAVNILWAGWRLIRESLGGLMDEAVPADTLGEIRKIISSNAEGAIEAHDLRTRLAGRATFIDFHLVVAGSMPVSEAHEICDRIEKALRAAVPDAMITIHVEPEEKAKHHGVLVL
ncbi:MAG TPA: cation diffusion facilitator family transporter [Bauldia sp.]|nr:cation diffusion facilitator family transporter [Bauldia sp.]